MQTVRGQRLNRGAKLKSPSWEAIIREPADYPDPAARAACAMAVRSRTSQIFPASDRRRKDFCKKSRVRFGTLFRWTVSCCRLQRATAITFGRGTRPDAYFAEFGGQHDGHNAFI